MVIDYTKRFTKTISLLVGKMPPPALVDDWLAHTNDDLQAWVLNNQQEWWPQGIAVLDAAHIMADQPKEGPLEDICYKRPRAVELNERLQQAENRLADVFGTLQDIRKLLNLDDDTTVLDGVTALVTQHEQITSQQSPVARAHITPTDGYPDIKLEILDGSQLQPEHSPVDIYTALPLRRSLKPEPSYWANKFDHLVSNRIKQEYPERCEEFSRPLYE